ncbi:hypothetical protein [Capnocytophaga catalasegens]|uniref:hypothetical protein n=1 Tax=Capnocytophaga catalasegens TaxID=1004260 RepID=UPI002231CE60|nr:hypothetical protein [Capnocytophaga catalasegens]
MGASEELKRIKNTALLIKEEIKNLFDQRKKAIEVHISDKKTIKKLVKLAREKIETEGVSQEIIKEHLASNFVGKGVVSKEEVAENEDVKKNRRICKYRN